MSFFRVLLVYRNDSVTINQGYPRDSTVRVKYIKYTGNLQICQLCTTPINVLLKNTRKGFHWCVREAMKTIFKM